MRPGIEGQRRLAAVVIGGFALVGAVIEYARTGVFTETLEALVAGALAGAVAVFAWSLPGARSRDGVRGAVIGACFIGNALLSTTFLDRPVIVWSTLLVEGALFALWSWPWLGTLRRSVRLGVVWLGVAYWLLGVIGALAVGHAGVGAQRLAYGGMLGLAVLAVIASTRRADGSLRDLSDGVVVAFVVALALLLLAGSGALFDAHHPVPIGVGADQNTRFWGGPWLLYHPNSMAGLAVAVAIRIGVGPAYTGWQRLTATGLAGLVIYLANARTAIIFMGTAAVVHAALLWWRSRRPVEALPEYSTPRRTWIAAAAPFVVLLLVLIFSGSGFLSTQRYSGGGVTSGRADTWATVFRDWRHDPVAGKLLGHANDARATVQDRGAKSRTKAADKLPTDNAAVGSLRRAGVLGVLAFLLGLVLLVRHALRRRAPAWFLVATIAALPAIATTDWLLGGTGGTLWILLATGEAFTLFVDHGESRPGIGLFGRDLTRRSMINGVGAGERADGAGVEHDHHGQAQR